jgi:cell division protein FtsL
MEKYYCTEGIIAIVVLCSIVIFITNLIWFTTLDKNIFRLEEHLYNQDKEIRDLGYKISRLEREVSYKKLKDY